MKFKRRKLLFFEGSAVATNSLALMFNALVSILSRGKNFLLPFIDPKTKIHSLLEQLLLQPVRRAMPLEISTITQLQQIEQYRSRELETDLVPPQCYTYNILDTCSDKEGNFCFGYKNYYFPYVKTRENQLYLTVNFNYISALPWIQTC